VGYPLVRLLGEERDLHRFLRNIEEALIRACADFGVTGERRAGWTGVWTGEKKLASIGIAVRRWVTMHGFALNVSTDLARFAMINPCGLDAAVMTSLSEVAGRPIGIEEVMGPVARHLAAVLGRTLAED
jgi:lipoate-protein ligase B